MNREQIREAAGEYMNIPPIKVAIECGDVEDLESHIKVAFMNGAEWRINSVFRKKPEIPIEGKPALVEYLDGNLSGKYRVDKYVDFTWKKKRPVDRIIRWAYIEDLLPDTKETEL